jgi:hypothetical protein
MRFEYVRELLGKEKKSIDDVSDILSVDFVNQGTSSIILRVNVRPTKATTFAAGSSNLAFPQWRCRARPKGPDTQPKIAQLKNQF